jgi:2'-5' RNA ligase
MRCFISIDLPDEIRREIGKIQKQIPEFIGKETESENLHLTLKFLGEIDEKLLEETKRRLKKIKFSGFESKLGDLGFFDKGDSGIVWIYLSSCEDLQKEIDVALKALFEPEKRFMSHLTIARIKKIKNKKKFLEDLKRIKTPIFSFKVSDFKLKKSTLKKTGSVYENLEIYPLKNEI